MTAMARAPHDVRRRALGDLRAALRARGVRCRLVVEPHAQAPVLIAEDPLMDWYVGVLEHRWFMYYYRRWHYVDIAAPDECADRIIHLRRVRDRSL